LWQRRPTRVIEGTRVPLLAVAPREKPARSHPEELSRLGRHRELRVVCEFTGIGTFVTLSMPPEMPATQILLIGSVELFVLDGLTDGVLR